MRPGLLVIALAACSAAPSTGPKWPRPAVQEPEMDGGESVAPRAAARAITSAVEDDAPDEGPADKPADAAPADATPSERPAAPPATDPEEPILTEEIVIEVSD